MLETALSVLACYTVLDNFQKWFSVVRSSLEVSPVLRELLAFRLEQWFQVSVNDTKYYIAAVKTEIYTFFFLKKQLPACFFYNKP